MFKQSIVALALFASQALAAIAFSSTPSTVVAGTTYTLTWTATGSGPATILLRQGDPSNLQTVATLTTTGTGGSFAWTAPSTFAPGSNYAFQITQGTDTNYSGLFTYSGGAAVASPAASASAAASVAASVSAPASVAASASAASISSYPTLLPSIIKNGTTSGNATTRASSSSSSSVPRPSASVVSANSAVAIGSPLALVLSAVAAMLYLQ